MFYYLIALLKSNAPLLTYASKEELSDYEIVSLDFKNKQKIGIVIKKVEPPSFECKEAKKTHLCFTQLQIKLANFIAQYYCSSYGETFGIFYPKEAQQNATTLSHYNPNLQELNKDQKEVFNFCKNKNFSLLFGDTGSGKTEIYFHLIDSILQQNKQILFLMPEISLTPQTEKRLKNTFGDIIGIWHSKISTKKKQEILKNLNNGQIRIIAGARSALFLPLEHLGLIIVDEEHDDAYKSQSRPRYNAKDLCIFLAKHTKIKVVLGSATPSLQSYHLAKKEQAIARIKGTFHKTKKEILFDSSQDILSQKLLQLLKESLDKKEQVIVFVPTRANFKTLLCSQCGNTITCKNCSVAMSLHHKKNMMLCHYCNFSSPITEKCPACNSTALTSKRLGTAQLLLELQEIFPQAKIDIFDKDHTSTNKKLKKILQQFKNQETDILIGTQMISKGHDFHNVNLAVILEIDYILKSPDFRCNEKALSLIYQVSGRSGRKENGRVLIQSFNAPFLKSQIFDYQDFLEYELENRMDYYPPFVKLILLHFEDKKETIAQQNMQEILSKLSSSFFEIVGYGKSGIEKVANIYRYHILIRTNQPIKTIKFLQHLFEKYKNFEIDVDPIDLS
ncbi:MULTISPECIES: primosomal protein N' [unclassified Helicobacter]|uniref:primosomal protein N' n=1 Tax=unclassified Helicobacter TaxID=2593540 RepID=UPI000CF14248|nr:MULTISPECIES: primosomal protein N' [unclassified Helicobacter]